MYQTAFRRFGPTRKLTAGTAVTSVQATIPGDNNKEQYRIVNTGTVVCYLAFGVTQAEAESACTVISTSGDSMPFVPGAVEIVSASGDSWVAAITSSGSAEIFITPGGGL